MEETGGGGREYRSRIAGRGGEAGLVRELRGRSVQQGRKDRGKSSGRLPLPKPKDRCQLTLNAALGLVPRYPPA